MALQSKVGKGSVAIWVLCLWIAVSNIVHSEETVQAAPVDLSKLHDGKVLDVRQIDKDVMISSLAAKDTAPAPTGTFFLQVLKAGKETLENLGVEGPVTPKDTLVTDASTIAHLTFPGGMTLVLGHNSKATIETREIEGEGLRTSITLHYGLLRARNSGKLQEKTITIETTAARIHDLGLGTVFIVRHKLPKPGKKAGVTVVTLVQGQVFGQGKEEEKKVKLVTSGQQARFGDPEEGGEGEGLNIPILDSIQLRKLMTEIPYLVEGLFQPGEDAGGGADAPPRVVNTGNPGTTTTTTLPPFGFNDEPTVSP